MKIAITGASGLIGSALCELLSEHEIFKLVRRKPKQEREVHWDYSRSEIDLDLLEKTDVVIHLAGKNIAAGRWTASLKREIVESRVKGTAFLAESLLRLKYPPKVFLAASAVGIYGNTAGIEVTEREPAGETFLARTTSAWEAQTASLQKAGVRVAHLRFGMVLGKQGGALKKMLLPFQLGVGGTIGSGAQYMSWISLQDTVRAIVHCAEDAHVAGPVNIVAPNAVRNAEFTRVLGLVLKRPTIFPLPAFVARLLLGEMADELLLSSVRVRPAKLEETGFRFEHPELEEALREILT